MHPLVPAVLGWWAAVQLAGLGNTVGYHRLLTHRGFKTTPALRAMWTMLGALHGGSPMVWVGLHRLHHTTSDQPDDPHSPTKGFWWSHTGWILGTGNPVLCILFALSGFGQQVAIVAHDLRRVMGRNPPAWLQLTGDLEKERLMRVLDTPGVMPLLFALQLAAAWAVGGGWGILWLWAVHVWLTNSSWAVNSLCHGERFGTAPHNTGELSRDVWWLAPLTNGEAYHNAHHRWPRSARHGLDGGSDLSWAVIRGLERAGLVWDVWLPRKYR